MEYDIEQIEKQNEKGKRTKQIVKKLMKSVSCTDL